MGRRPWIECALAAALSASAWSASVPIPQVRHTAVFQSVPDADILAHGEYRLKGRFQYFNSSVLGAVDTSLDETPDPGSARQAQNMNYGSELAFGIENRVEVGIRYGKTPSLALKALVWREDLFWPDIVFGARNLFGSEEGELYGVTDSRTLKNLQSESFVTLAKTFGARTRFQGGVSVLVHGNKGPVSFNGGVEQDLGGGAQLGYEVFERFSDFHQVLTLQWTWRQMVGLAVSLTEFQSWIRQDGEWGLFVAPSGDNPDGYNSPGISVSLHVAGWVPHRVKRTLPERVAILEVKNAELERQVEELDSVKRRLALLETRPAASPPVPDSAVPRDTAKAVSAQVGDSASALSSPARQAVALLKTLTRKGESDLTDPVEIRDLMAQVVALGPEAAAIVKRAAADTAAGPVRVRAVLVMAFSKDPDYEASLRALCSDSNPRIRREALVALVKLGSRAALEDAKRLLSDPDETVALAAGEVYKRLKAAGTKPAKSAQGAAGARSSSRQQAPKP